MSEKIVKNPTARHNYEIIETIEARNCLNRNWNKINKKSEKSI